MPSRVNASQVRTAAPTKSASSTSQTKQPGAAEVSTTKGAAWGPGAKTESLRISGARIGDGPKTGEVKVPKGFKAEVKTFDMKASDKVHGEPASLEQSTQQLTLTAPGGKKVTIGGGPESLKQFTDDWKSEVAAAKKEPKNEWTRLQWDSQSGLSGAGTAGKLVSLSEGGSSYMGGAHPNHGTILRTYDANTGKPVKLDDLLSQKQVADLVKQIEKQLPGLSGPDGIEGSSFHFGDTASLRETINENFAVTQGKDGKVKIEIAWESGIHALGGQMAHFTVDAPNDPAFRARIGLE
jgi:hypothetical protein